MREMKQRLLNGIKSCNCCGARMLFQGYNAKGRYVPIMKREGICYDCAFWMDVIEHPPENMEVIGDVCMKIYPLADKKDKSIILGGKGKKRFFMRSDLSVFESNDVWVVGRIPERFRRHFKTTAVEIPQNVYKRLSNENRICQSKACLDRYSCIKYNLEIERKKGPYNKVPPNWKAGGEHCGFYLDKKLILTDESSVLK